uniref:testis-expressed protein 13B n=1 Tax=Nyctereutes procyonoides TaxID=34880 RepID=UPI00244527F7|nr:testis-expressed protein 13B [Nyctereutes procyonoides]
MALKPEDPSGGFQHDKVVAFINEKMAGHTKGPEFYLENLSLSWEEVENKLRTILEDTTVSSEAKEACAWSSLALGVRFAHKQGQLQGRRVHWLQDFAKLHKSATQALASDLKELTAQQDMERQEAAFQLRQTQANLTEMQKEQDLLRWKLLRAELGSPREREQRVQVAEEPGLTTASGAGTEGAGEEEEEAGAAATSATTADTIRRGRRRQKDSEGSEVTKKLGRGPTHIFGAEEQKNYTTGNQIISKLEIGKNSCKPQTIKENVRTGPGGMSGSDGRWGFLHPKSLQDLDRKLVRVLIKLYRKKQSKQA